MSFPALLTFSSLFPSLRRGLLVLTITALAACSSTPPPPAKGSPPAPGTSGPAAPPPPAPAAPAAKPAFVRPAAGETIAKFNGKQNKGIDIAGALGDPVLATADGRIVIVSNALRGYGTMIIIKHNETYISAYAHIDKALVKENQVVRQGQQIAEMGKSGTDRVKLHFEIRKQGVAVNPQPYLDGKLR
ncbi:MULTISPECIES: peptidoglycan DD-metalloendopeptidase family protein [unclassified Variovorax]|uniref:peptidoglycan DD-metalloendopeptidase family protein n=1 Tax=unclassified Variovorax TaxID=663243 RepID=UPI001BD4C5FC|nr:MULTISPECIES: peptidoglycan DD-metalloendopeptidase family protein [unclassified Variovorax]